MKTLLAVLVVTIVSLTSAMAGEMVGTVRSYYDFKVVGGATVEALLNNTVVARTSSASDGKYRFWNLPHSYLTYSVRATKGTLKGTNANCALFLPNRWYWYPATCNVNIR